MTALVVGWSVRSPRAARSHQRSWTRRCAAAVSCGAPAGSAVVTDRRCSHRRSGRCGSSCRWRSCP
jgi:hypothetical protein